MEYKRSTRASEEGAAAMLICSPVTRQEHASCHDLEHGPER